MTAQQVEHLRLLDAHLTALLDLAAKRTPGEWKHRHGQMCSHWVSRADELSNICEINTESPYTSAETSQNAAFIAACAGRAEAGWRSTKKSIEWAIFMDTNGQVGEGLLESILAEWPIESLT